MHCGSGDINPGKSGFDGGTAWQEVSCNSCGENWQDQYELVGTDVEPKPGDERDAQSLLGALGIERDRLEGEFIEVAGVSLYSVDAGDNFPGLNVDDNEVPDYEVTYFEADGGWDITESLYDFNQKWIVLNSESSKGCERKNVVMVATYTDGHFRNLVRHLMQQQIAVPDGCDRLPGLLQEVIDQEIDNTPGRPWCGNTRKAL